MMMYDMYVHIFYSCATTNSPTLIDVVWLSRGHLQTDHSGWEERSLTTFHHFWSC